MMQELLVFKVLRINDNGSINNQIMAIESEITMICKNEHIDYELYAFIDV